MLYIQVVGRIAVIQQVAKYPDSGVHLGSGLYKTRVGAPGRGKRGGARVIYLWITASRTIFLLAAYAKNEKNDLTAAELKLLRKFAESLRGT